MPKYLTKEGLEKFKKELEESKTVKRKEISERLKHAASFGDLAENAAYHEAKEAQAFLEDRINELRKIISGAMVVENQKNGRVQIGSSVTISSIDGEEKFQIVEHEEANSFAGKISFQSPLGKLLLGKLEGETVKFQTPQGKIDYKIIKIE
ncbi:MAG: transcription elongation factor GreA [Candidatus Nealsonbacteria bacterium]|nr:transcription elongation factor GreA [Candidatus Nealsonbacteria bacterium]